MAVESGIGLWSAWWTDVFGHRNSCWLLKSTWKREVDGGGVEEGGCASLIDDAAG